MSEDEQSDTCCASCGISEIDDIKLKECDGCDLIRYCSDECRENHKAEHEEDCKKRAAELRDELLFKQPDSSHLGDCPICCVPLPINVVNSMMSCCSIDVCMGCRFANQFKEMERRLIPSCPFCREPTLITDEEWDERRMKRVEANDPYAVYQLGGDQYNKGDYSTAFEYFARAAELGFLVAHHDLGNMYRMGHGVEKDMGKAMYHYEEAAIGGHPESRYNLGSAEWNNRNIERALKHYIIAATQGNDDSIKRLMKAFKFGLLEKEDLASVLRAHKAAVDATKSPQREKAAELMSQYS